MSKYAKALLSCLRMQYFLLIVSLTISNLCTVVDCNSLMAPANGSVNHPQTTFMATATYSCNLGYIIEGQTTRMCQVDGTWSGSAPTCRAGN